MTTIVTRAGKGSALTHNEVDANFTNLNDAKYESGNSASFTNLAYTGTLTGGTGVINIGSGQVYKDTSGNVGIGTSSPNSNFILEVAGTSFAQMITTSIFGVIGNNLFFGTGNWRYSGNGHGYGWTQTGTNGSDLVLNYAPNNTSSTGAVASSLSERMRIDSSGNVGIGTSSPAFKLQVAGRQFIQDATQPTIYLGNTTSDYNAVFYDPPSKIGYVSAEGAGTQLVFRTQGSERMRIDADGRVKIGTSTLNSKFAVEGANGGDWADRTMTLQGTIQPGIGFAAITDASAGIFKFWGAGAQFECRNAGDSGFISILASAFTVSSDYRIKTAIKQTEAVLPSVLSLNPVSYIKDGVQGREHGLIAHEVAEHFPELVGGEKDAMRKDGSMDLQTVNYMSLTVILTKAIQELSAKVDTLQAELNTLKGN